MLRWQSQAQNEHCLQSPDTPQHWTCNLLLVCPTASRPTLVDLVECTAALQALQAAVGEQVAGGVLVGAEGGRAVYWDSPQATPDGVSHETSLSLFRCHLEDDN